MHLRAPAFLLPLLTLVVFGPAVFLPRTCHAAVAGEGLHKKLHAVRAQKPPVIDGKLDDSVWNEAPVAGGFTQTFPDEGKPPTEATEVRVAYDDDNLYFGVDCWDSSPADISERLTRRDRDIETDWLALYIDSRHDHNSALIFQLSAAGVQVDGQMFGDTEYSGDWDSVWSGAVSRNERGWHAEFAIPFTVLRFSDAAEQLWGIQIHRNVSRRREQSMWTFSPSNVVGMVSRFGHLEGIRNIRPRRTFELLPYAVARLRARSNEGGALFALGDHGAADTEAALDAGLDLKLGVTSRLTLDATINPDFGQVEADQVVLNLSHFETFFPEKRPFFLEGRAVFETPLVLFYPRRIGRPAVGFGPGAAVGESIVTDASGGIPIWTAVKLTGNLGDQLHLGTLAALTGAEVVTARDGSGRAHSIELAPNRFYAVARGQLQLGTNSNLGVAATAVTRLDGEIYTAAANHDAYTQGIDGRWQDADGRWRVAGQLVLSERVGGTAFATSDGRPCAPRPDDGCQPITRADGTRLEPGDVGVGAWGRLTYSQDKIFAEATATSMSPKLDLNDAGFLPEFNTHTIKLVGGWTERNGSDLWHRWAGFLNGDFALSWDGVIQRAGLSSSFEGTSKGLIFFQPFLQVNFPGTYDSYETFDGAYFEQPSNLEGNVFLGNSHSERVVIEARVRGRKNFANDGYAISGNVQLAWQALSNLELALNPEVGFDQGAVRRYDCNTADGTACAIANLRHYRFARLDSEYVSVVFRGSYTFITTLSLQAYAQLFFARGDYSEYRELDTIGFHPFIHRADLRPAATGTADGFASGTLNLNVVLRWEPIPGSQLFLVFTRGQSSPFFAPGKLNRGPTEDTFLLKFVYYYAT